MVFPRHGARRQLGQSSVKIRAFEKTKPFRRPGAPRGVAARAAFVLGKADRAASRLVKAASGTSAAVIYFFNLERSNARYRQTSVRWFPGRNRGRTNNGSACRLLSPHSPHGASRTMRLSDPIRHRCDQVLTIGNYHAGPENAYRRRSESLVSAGRERRRFIFNLCECVFGAPSACVHRALSGCSDQRFTPGRHAGPAERPALAFTSLQNRGRQPVGGRPVNKGARRPGRWCGDFEAELISLSRSHTCLSHIKEPLSMDVRRTIPIAGLTLLVSIGAAQQPGRVDDTTLRNAGKSGNDWLTYGLTPGETRYSPLNQIDTTQRESPRTGMVVRSRLRWRRAGSHAPGFERHDLRDHQLERCLRRRRPHRQGTLALGPRSESGHRALENLLRRGQSRPCDLPGHDHRSGDRWQAAGAERGNRESRFGKRASLTRRTTTRSRWRRASPKEK